MLGAHGRCLAGPELEDPNAVLLGLDFPPWEVEPQSPEPPLGGQGAARWDEAQRHPTPSASCSDCDWFSVATWSPQEGLGDQLGINLEFYLNLSIFHMLPPSLWGQTGKPWVGPA